MAKKKKRNDGLQEITFSFNGKRYHVYGKTIAEAKEKVEQKKADLKKGKYKKGKELSLDEYHARWEKARYGTVTESTIRKQNIEYKAISSGVIDEAGTTFGSLIVSEIETQNVRDLQDWMKERKRESGKHYYNTNTINDCMALLKHILYDAVEEGIMEKNPAKPIKALKRTEPEARDTNHRALSEEETKKFFELAINSWYYDCYRFMLFSGCRMGEVGALTLADIKSDVIEIRRTVTKNDIGQYIISNSTKTKKSLRDIPLTEELKEIIHHQKSINRMLRGNVISLDDRLFTSPEGKLLDNTCVNRDISRWCKRAGIEKFTCHAFRDTFATRCIESGMNYKTLQEILGHTDISVTMNIYAHVMQDTKITEMQKVKISI